ncbi:MAG: PAS domain-containing protein [Actinomycetota bacterium]|nr:PAS domain-containing protein [Actinomycetota bacterium]
MLGYERSELGGRAVTEVLEGSGLTDLDEPLRDGKPRALEATGWRKDGTSFPARVTLGLVEDGGLPMFMALVHGLTDENSSRERIEYLSGHDALTGRLNKERFTAHVDDSIDRSSSPTRSTAARPTPARRWA